MTQEQTASLVEENMKTIFAYALSRVSHREDAEDLAGDIVLAILQSGAKIRDDNAFFGYIWAIAANTYKKFLRKRNRAKYESLDEETAEERDFTAEILKSQEFSVLRRELALLSREYRECTVAYYFEGLSCAETAHRLHLSLEMVKYYLFKTRRILKEGISMEREFGTKSYNPAKFNFITIFNDMFNQEYQNLFSRKLPGNILVSAYYTPMTVRELAIELGVASVYLEDEIALLERYRLITPLPGGKYQTRLVIFTEEYMNEFYRTAEKTLIDDIGGWIGKVRERLPEIKALGFPGSDLGEDLLIWSFFFELIRNGWRRFTSVLGKDGEPSEIYRGATGTSYGHTYEVLENDAYSVHDFAGYQGMKGHYAASYADFGIIPRKNRPSAHFKELEEKLDAMCEGAAKAVVPILSAGNKKTLEAIFAGEIARLAEIFGSLYRCAVDIMRTHAPESTAPLIKNVLANALLFHTVGLIGACAVKSGALSIPESDLPLGLFLYETE